MACDDFFEQLGIPYEPNSQDEAVRAVLSADFYDPAQKKWLISCWFQETFGSWTTTGYDTVPASAAMSAFLIFSDYDSYEDMIEATL